MKRSLLLIILFITTVQLMAQRPMEKLDRSVVAQKVSNGVYVNWRITSDEWYNTAYKLYRDGNLIYTTTASGASNYLDAAGAKNSKYSVSAVRNGVESLKSAEASVLTKHYLEIPLRDIKKLGKQLYYPNDATAADLDGDGQYEVIIKRMNRNWEADCVDFTYFEAYKMDGTFLWAIDVGPNITMDVEINIAAFDFDGDGKAEVFMRSSDNTVFGLDINNQGGVSVGDRDGDGYTNYRQAPFYGIGGDGFMNAGPEYLSLIDGMTGKELDWVNFIPRGSSSDWGDGYGHRANKFFFGAPYLDGKKPSLFIGRGIYTQTKMQAYDVVNKKLVSKWFWESGSYTNKQQGKWDETPKVYYGNGYHNYTIADVDDDGKDEINWGSMTVDDDGKPLYSTELGHGDAQHYGDFDPYRKGQEMFACNESKPGTNLRDAKNGKLLYRKVAASDVGRACAGNISDLYKGAEVWGGGVGLSATDRVEMSHFGLPENYCIYWDGDLLQEALDHNFSSSTGVGNGKIVKFNAMGSISTLLTADAYSCNYTKGTPCLQADIMGDWREEAIWWRTDSLALRIYTTPYATTNRIYTLMHDHQYRQAICWQMCGYNQPPHTSFYLGGDFPVPIPAKSTNGKLVFRGNSTLIDNTTPNFVSGDDMAGVLSGSAAPVAFQNGKSILLDEHSALKSLTVNGNLQPELLMVAGNDNYTIAGSGTFSGAMILDKTGEGTLSINGNHSYTGKTDVWEGNMLVDGSLSGSAVTVRRHAGFGGKVTMGAQLTTEYNASVFPGGISIADTMKVTGNMILVNGAKLVVDLSDNPAIPDVAGIRSAFKNDFVVIDGTLQLASGSIIQINAIADSLTSGKYRIAKVNAVAGSLTSVKIIGAGGKSVSLSYDQNSKDLFLIIVGTRSASAVKWTGKAGTSWNVAKTVNWNMDGLDDIFVNNDSVQFDNAGYSRTITVLDSVYVSDMVVDIDNPRSYSFSGTSINGPMSLTKRGTGTLTMNNRNAFTGKVIVEQGSLVMQYAPSAINNGGIGTNITNPAYLVLKDSAVLQVTTANEQTTRGLTLEGESGGFINVTANLYWDGLITGTKLTKTGGATLYLGSSNPNLTETVLTSGTIRLNSNASVINGVGKKITMLAGTLDTKNEIGTYLSSSHEISVPAGCTANVNAAPRCEYNGALTGAGTLNWNTDYIRAYMNGNWSAFTGIINLKKNGANSTYDDIFIVNNSYGYPNATVNLALGVIMTHNSGTNSTVKIGMLTGAGTFDNAILDVGSNNGSGSFTGVISGGTSVKKSGTGTWTVSGVNTYTGTTIVNGGALTLTGSIANGAVTVQNGATMNLAGSMGAGTLAVQNGGTMNLTGSIGAGTLTVQTGGVMNHTGTNAGAIIIQTGAVLNIGGTSGGVLSNSGTLKGTGTINGNVSLGANSVTSPGANSIGTLTFKGNVTMNASSKLDIQISGTNTADKAAVTGTLTCNGILNVTLLSGTPADGSAYTLFSAGTINGTFATVNLPVLDASLEWDLSELYTLGKIRVKMKTALYNPGVELKLAENPTSGLFRILTNNTVDNAGYVVSDLTGKIVSNGKISLSDNAVVVDLTSYPNGMYLMWIKSKDFYEQFKLIKR